MKDINDNDYKNILIQKIKERRVQVDKNWEERNKRKLGDGLTSVELAKTRAMRILLYFSTGYAIVILLLAVFFGVGVCSWFKGCTMNTETEGIKRLIELFDQIIENFKPLTLIFIGFLLGKSIMTEKK